MTKFAKTFDIEDRQLLVYVEYDSEQEGGGDIHIVHQIFKAPLGMVDVALKMPEKGALMLFDMYGDAEAANLFKVPLVEKLLATGAGAD